MILFWTKRSKKIKKDNGFTLIEVIVSIALLSALSVVLLQMFTVSGRTNRSAYELDTANALCVEATEMYKEDPRDGSASEGGTYLLTPDFTRTIDPSGEITYTKNIDSRFQLEIKSTNGGSTSMPISYYPAAAYEYAVPELSTDINIVLEWDPVENNIDIKIGGSTEDIEIDSNIIFSDYGMTNTAMIPIHLDFSNNNENPVEVNVENKIGLIPNGSGLYEAIADIYLCETKESNNVSVVPVEGMSTENKITKKVQKITKYSGEIRVIRISDSVVLAKNSVEEYWVGN